MANQYLKALLSKQDKAQHLDPNAPLFGYAMQPLPGSGTVQQEAFYSPYNSRKMVAGAGFSALGSMNTTGGAFYIPMQTRQTLDGYGSGVGPFDIGDLQGLSPQSHAVGIYTPATALYSASQNSGPS